MKGKTLIIAAIAVLLTGAVIVGALLWNGIILINNPSGEEFPIRGVDVSAYQGEIDWQVLSEQDISFAFIKATEGSSFTDTRFEYNYKEALKTDLRVGAYHFFSFDSLGRTQGEHFINTVEKTENMLPPVIDLELYGSYTESPPNADTLCAELTEMIDLLKAHYGMSPIIYVTEETYTLYIANRFADCPIWYKNVYGKKLTPEGRKCDFWQYTNRANLEGYSGEEKYIDMNVFFGTAEEFASFGKTP